MEASQPSPNRDNTEIRQASRAVAWNGVVSISTALFGMAASVVTIRLLTKADYGLFTTAARYLQFATILVLGTLDLALLRYVPEYRHRRDRKGLVELIAKVLGMHAGMWLLLCGVTLVLARPISHMNGQDLTWLLYAGILVVLPSVLSLSLQAILTSFFSVRIQAIATIAGGILQIACLFLFIKAFRWGGPGAMLAQVGMSGFTLLVFAYQVSRLPFPGQESSYVPCSMKRILSFSAPYVLSALAQVVFLRQSEVFFLLPYWGPETTATYGYAYMLAQRFLEFVPAMFYGVGNVLASTAIQESRERLARVMNIYWRILAIALIATSIGGFALADRLAAVLFGAKGADAARYASILFLTQAAIAFVNPYNFIMRAEEKTWLTFWLSPPAAVISLGASFLLIPKYGLNGAVVATSLSFFLVTALQYVVFRRTFPYVDVPWSYFGRCYVASAPMLFAIPVKNLLPGFMGFVAGFAAALVMWAIGARAMRLVGPDEADLLRRSGLPGAESLLKVLTR